MTRKTFTSSIEEGISVAFKEACEVRGIKMNAILEAFMRQFINDEISISITKEGIVLRFAGNNA